jgi:hypothetical protein
MDITTTEIREARDYTGKLCPMPTPPRSYTRRRTYEGGIVELWADRADFAIVYGLQMKTGLSYAEAAADLGASLLHAVRCDGKLD